MLRAIATSGHILTIMVDDKEYRDLDLPDGVLTQEELNEVRLVRPTALPGYVVYTAPEPEPEE